MCKEICVPYGKISYFVRWFLFWKLATYGNVCFQIRSIISKLSSCFKEGVDVFSYHVQYNLNHHEIRGFIESIRCWRSRCQLGENQPPAAMIAEIVRERLSRAIWAHRHRLKSSRAAPAHQAYFLRVCEDSFRAHELTRSLWTTKRSSWITEDSGVIH